MNQTYPTVCHLARPGERSRRLGVWRRLAGVSFAGLLSAAFLLLGPAFARADSSSTLTVIGTSDVSDSGLVQNVIEPDFAKADPQYAFKYIGTASGTAIAQAESGAAQASVLIVHAASLENQFVANGYSYEQYGRAIFINDFVLGGPSSDPAGVGANASHNIEQAFADIATAGINGGGTPKVTFVSRGGTPGTTVEEHSIWALVAASPNAPAGLLLCAVGAAEGGGDTPIAANNGVTANGQPCPNGGALPTSSQLPSWYVVTGEEQGPNVVTANACNGYPSGPNTCYVLSDRGTYDYLASGTDALGTIPNLAIMTSDNSASAPGGADALVNYFHAYIINPTKPFESVNLPAAQALLNMLTSPSFQAQLKNYLATSAGGPPFVADASPLITASGFPKVYKANKPLTITGTVTNAEPGYPAIAGKPVDVDEVVAGVPVTVASGTTTATGTFSIKFVPTSSGSYEVSTPQISQIENTKLNPPFGDVLSPSATAPVSMTVQSVITMVTVRAEGGRALIFGSVSPGTGHVKATVQVLGRPAGSRHHFKALAGARLGAGDGNFAILVPLAAGRWQIEVRFQDPKALLASISHVTTVTVGASPAARVSLSFVREKTGVVKVSGTVSPAGPGRVHLLGLDEVAGAPARFATLAGQSVNKNHVKFTLKGKVKAGTTWELQVVYTPSGQAAGYSRLMTVNVR